MSRESKALNLTEGVIWKQLLLFLIPTVIGTLFQQLYNTADAIIVGQFVGSDALAAVGGSASVIIQLMVGIFTGLSSGATVVIAHSYGAEDRERLSRAVHTSLAFSLGAGALLSAVGILSAPMTLALTKNPADIMEPSVLYLRLYFVGMIPMMLFNMGAGILRAVGDSRRPLYYLVVFCLLNILLDLLLVAGLKLGVAGAAAATVLSNLVSALLIIGQLTRTEDSYRYEPRRTRLHGPTLLHILGIGVPAAIETSMYSFSNLLIQIPVNDLGTDAVAAWAAADKVSGIYWSLVVAFGVSIMAFVGQNCGAGKVERMRKGIRVCLGMATVMTAVLGGLLLLFVKYCFRIFTDNPEVIGAATEVIFFFVPFHFLWNFIEVLANAFRGAGDAVVPMVISVGGICGVRILWILLMVPHWNSLIGISAGYPVSWLITDVILILYYKGGRWLKFTPADPES